MRGGALKDWYGTVATVRYRAFGTVGTAELVGYGKESNCLVLLDGNYS